MSDFVQSSPVKRDAARAVAGAGHAFSGQHALGHGGPADLSQAQLLTGGDDFLFDDPPEQGVLGLVGDEVNGKFPGECGAGADFFDGPFGGADMYRALP